MFDRTSGLKLSSEMMYLGHISLGQVVSGMVVTKVPDAYLGQPIYSIYVCIYVI